MWVWVGGEVVDYMLGVGDVGEGVCVDLDGSIVVGDGDDIGWR